MTAPSSISSLPAPPDDLHFGEIRLRLDRIVPSDPSRDFVPYYHFRVMTLGGAHVGHINFRVGDTEHVRLFAGHIGFQIVENCRGRGYARQACHAIAPLVRSVYKTVLITCDPENLASMRTIERLGATFIDEVAVPSLDPHLQRGPHSKRRYAWMP